MQVQPGADLSLLCPPPSCVPGVLQGTHHICIIVPVHLVLKAKIIHVYTCLLLPSLLSLSSLFPLSYLSSLSSLSSLSFLSLPSLPSLPSLLSLLPQICKYDIEQSISREMSGDLKTGMLTVGRHTCLYSDHVHVNESRRETVLETESNFRPLLGLIRAVHHTSHIRTTCMYSCCLEALSNDVLSFVIFHSLATQ